MVGSTLAQMIKVRRGRAERSPDYSGRRAPRSLAAPLTDRHIHFACHAECRMRAQKRHGSKHVLTLATRR